MRATSVSVAMPVFNGQDYVVDAIQSVLAQTRPADEVLVFDNCSTDRTVELAAALLGPSAIRNSATNIGATANFNRAARGATGTYFAWLAAGDRLQPTFLERCVETLSRYPDRAACLTGIQFIAASGEPLGVQTDLDLADDRPQVRFRSFLRRRRWTEAYCLYRRSTLVGSPLLEDTYAPDVRMTWWFLLRAPLAVVAEPLLVYRMPDARRSAEAVALALNPNQPRTRWKKPRLWYGLWRMAGDEGVASEVRDVARRELVLALMHRDWIRHLIGDLEDTAPHLFAIIDSPRALIRRIRGVERPIV